MPIFAILAAILVQIAWGLNYSASKFAMVDFPPLLLTTIRFTMLSLMLAPFAAREGWPGWRRLRDLGIVGLATLVFHFTTLLIAMHMGLNITSCILAVQLGVPFSCILSAIVFRDYLGPWRSTGMGIAFLGVLMVAGTPNAYQHWDAFIVAIVSAFGWSLGNLYLKIMKPEKVVVLLFWPGLMALFTITLLSLTFESHQLELIRQASLRGWLCVGYSAAVSSIVGYGLWNWLMTHYPVNEAVPYMLLLPIFGITGGVVFFHDPVSWRILLGAVFTISGVGIIAFRRPKLVQAENM